MVLSPYYVSNIPKDGIYVDDNLMTKFIDNIYSENRSNHKKYRKATKKYAKMNTPKPIVDEEISARAKEEAARDKAFLDAIKALMSSD
jgi:hypothetical protein